MNTILQSRLSAIESALDALVTSIANYNPNLTHATTLIQADAEFQQSLSILQHHHANARRIHQLRAISAAQKAEIKSAVDQSGEAWRTLDGIHVSLSTPEREKILDKAEGITISERDDDTDGEGMEMTIEELLNYAHKLTKPPIKPLSRDSDSNSSRAFNALSDEEKDWLHPNAQMQNPPWPSDEMIRKSALGSHTQLAEGGVKLKSGTSIKEENSAGIVKEVNKSTEVHEQGRTAGAAHVMPSAVPKVFGGLDLYNPDAE